MVTRIMAGELEVCSVLTLWEWPAVCEGGCMEEEEHERGVGKVPKHSVGRPQSSDSVL